MISRRTLSLALATTAAATAATMAALPSYTGLQLQASDRSTARFNLPTPGASEVVGISPGSALTLGNDRHLAFHYSFTKNVGSYYPDISDNVWYGQNSTGNGIVQSYSGAFANAALGMASDGRLAFSYSDNAFPFSFNGVNKTKGIYLYQGSTVTTAGANLTTVTNTGFGFAGPGITADGSHIGSVVQTTSTSGSNALRNYTVGGGFTDYAASTTASPPGTLLFLSSTAFGRGQHAVIRDGLAGTGPLVRYNPGGTSTTMTTGSYAGLQNSNFAVAGNGTVVFWSKVTELIEDPNDPGNYIPYVSNKLVKTSDGVTFTDLAVENTGSFGAFGSGSGNTTAVNFAPVVNENGQVAFRANDNTGKNAIWVTDGTTTTRLITVGDSVRMANGTSTTISGFSSNLGFNDAGEVAFVASYPSGTNSRGAYIAAVTPTWSAASGGTFTTAGNWAGGVPNATSASAYFGPAATSAAAVTINSAVTLGGITFENLNAYTLSGSGSITLANATNPAAITSIDGAHTISLPIAVNNDLALNVNGDLALGGALTSSSPRNVTKLAPGTLILSGPLSGLKVGGLEVRDGKLVVAASGLDSHSLKVTSLTLTGGTSPKVTLDLNDNKLAVDYTGISVLPTIVKQIKSARNGYDVNIVTRWDGKGITSTKARNDSVAAGFDLYSLGAINNADLADGSIGRDTYSTFGGQSVDSSSVLVRYTYSGDADLNGFVDGDDYALIDNAFNLLIPNFGWMSGDFNYDGNIDGDDYALIDSGFLFQGSPLPAAATSSVPEPAALGLLATAAAALLRRGRRSR